MMPSVEGGRGGDRRSHSVAFPRQRATPRLPSVTHACKATRRGNSLGLPRKLTTLSVLSCFADASKSACVGSSEQKKVWWCRSSGWLVSLEATLQRTGI